MKTLVYATFSLFLGIVAVRGQMGGGSPGPGLSGSTAKLFGDNTTFSANLEMRTGGESDGMTMPGKLYFDQGSSRFEMDMAEMKGTKLPAGAAEQMKSMGMDHIIVISRPDKKVGYQVYPGMQAYLESQLPHNETPGQSSEFKLELTELSKETVEGHSCVKNKAVVTDKEGNKHESLVWNATDLKNFPIKIEHTEQGTKVTMIFREINFSKPQADLFEPPRGATKYDSMQSMMQQIMMKQLGGAHPPQGQ
jgi:hypothetical protein